MYSSALIAALACTFLLPEETWALPSGAPNSACALIFPRHAGIASQNLSLSPYTLDISSFDGSYSPGERYTLTLSGSQSFRGLLVQARTVADDTPVGSFTAESGVTRLSSCDRPDSAITHSSRSDKTSVDLPFTAPPAGTGPIRFRFAVVQVFTTFYAPVLSAVIQEAIPPVELNFVNNTPIVTGNDIFVQLSVNPPVPLLCQLITRGEPLMPIFTAEQDCSSGEATFLNVEGGRHRVRVIAGDRRAVVRRRVLLMPDQPNFCSLNAINSGVTRTLNADGSVLSYTIEFRPIGDDVGFICFVNRDSPEFFSCSSPLVIPAEGDPTSVKVTPDPGRCRGRRRPLVFRLD